MIFNPKVTVADRTQLDRERAVELMKLTMVAGEAMKTVLTQHGVDIGRINYHDNGNWRARVARAFIRARARRHHWQTYGHFLKLPPTAQAFRAQPPLHPPD